ncbi:sulfhydryl oxidase 1-like [Drosophila eugracilis]|uniref:sulfhydryl oxidase 1-like n=1 Tax=Drosophila eugracilis TaxID=29029 RepID=UPI001BDB10B5|nr:sulfhydryl oxidase 1-like [Drosophila eugracilis]
MRYFPSNFIKSTSDIGKEVGAESLHPNNVVRELAGLLAKNDYSGTNELKPIFQHLQSNETKESIFNRYAGKVFYILLVLEPPESQIGIEIVLDLLPYPDVAVRILKNEDLFTNLGVKPSGEKIALLDRSGKEQSLTISGQNSSDYVDSVSQFLVQTSPPTIYQADLELAIYQITHIEIPKVSLLTGYKLKALRHNMRLLNKYGPLRKNGKHLMKSLVKYVKSNDEITGEQFFNKVNETQEGPWKSFSGTRFIGCVGSKDFARRITCSFWVLFHHLTVRAAEIRTYPPSSVIIGLYGFVKYFFSCSVCTKHFQKMAKRRRIASVRTHDQEILWLWEAHNEVNQLLSGDATEDPKFPKVQFPQRKHCPSCYRSRTNRWNKAEVLRYLKRIYSTKNLSFNGIST